MSFAKKPTLVVLSLCSFIVTILTFVHFTKFLSDFTDKNFNISSYNIEEALIGIDPSAYVTQAIVIDTSLLSIFIVQHSSLILPLQDMISNSVRLPELSRTIYNILTVISLQSLMHFWKPIPHYCLWNIDYKDTQQFEFFVGVHTVSWIIIYIMALTMDITDLLGIKQIYFHITGHSGITLQSQKLKQLHKKMRHPSLLGFALIFWIYPCMRLDRLVLASVWTLYMILAWRPDTMAYNYVVQQQNAKNLCF